MKPRYRIVVCGAGVTGLAMAMSLASLRRSAELELCLVDANPAPDFDPDAGIGLRVSAIASGSAALLDSLGAWERVVSTRACAYQHMRVWDAAGTPADAATLRFDADEFGVAALGHIVENALIQAALLEVLREQDVELRFEAPIERLADGELVLANDERLSADLVIAADGSRSLLREQAGIGVSRHPYRQTAVVTHLRPELPHRDTAWQRFLDTGPLALLPLPDGRVSLVWSTTSAAASELLELSDDALSEAVSVASDHALGVLRVDAPRGSFPLAAQHAERYVRQGLALIGDAAHAVHPLAGQGANLGFRDVQVLSDVVGAALDRGEHPGDRIVLRRYERERKGANAAMMHFLTGLNSLFGADSKLVGRLRRTGMRLFNASGPIRSYAVSVALGVR